jgi:hypothetical protein
LVVALGYAPLPLPAPSDAAHVLFRSFSKKKPTH